MPALGEMQRPKMPTGSIAGSARGTIRRSQMHHAEIGSVENREQVRVRFTVARFDPEGTYRHGALGQYDTRRAREENQGSDTPQIGSENWEQCRKMKNPLTDHELERRLDGLDLLPQLRAFLRKHPELVCEPSEAQLFNQWWASYRLASAMNRTTPERN